MANNLNGINIAQVAQESLDALLTEFYSLNYVTKDFSGDVSQAGESVTTRIPTLSGGAVDLSGGYDAALNNALSTAKTVTLNKFKGYVYGFSDLEIAKAGSFDWLKNMFIKPAINTLLEAVNDDLLALVTAANFSDSDIISAANFDSDDLADKAGALSDLKVPRSDRFAMLNPTYHASLMKDTKVSQAYAYGSNSGIVDSKVPRVHGFEVIEYTGVPSNSENLVGFVGHPTALLMASRPMAEPVDFYGTVETVQDSSTGLSIQTRSWYDPGAGKQIVSVGLLYGVAVGHSAAISRITTA